MSSVVPLIDAVFCADAVMMVEKGEGNKQQLLRMLFWDHAGYLILKERTSSRAPPRGLSPSCLPSGFRSPFLTCS